MKCNTNHTGMKHRNCCCSPSFHRHFLTKQEKIENLEQYKKNLNNEKQAVEKIIEELKKERN